jgi:hypothetical protein
MRGITAIMLAGLLIVTGPLTAPLSAQVQAPPLGGGGGAGGGDQGAGAGAGAEFGVAPLEFGVAPLITALALAGIIGAVVVATTQHAAASPAPVSPGANTHDGLE